MIGYEASTMKLGHVSDYVSILGVRMLLFSDLPGTA